MCVLIYYYAVSIRISLKHILQKKEYLYSTSILISLFILHLSDVFNRMQLPSWGNGTRNKSVKRINECRSLRLKQHVR